MRSVKKPVMRMSQWYQGILAGDRSILAKAITLAESTRAADRKKFEQLLKRLLPKTGKSIRIGISGVPGVGKSTFIESFGQLLTAEGKRVAVLAVDPTSQLTKGSILGDKTRMEMLSRHPNVFIRPTPSRLALGGVSFHTRESILLCEAAGFDVILIETVGVGQSETLVHNLVDFFLLLLIGGTGDDIQGIKKGIMEMADGVVINKADGDNIKSSMQAKADAQQGLHLLPPSTSGWTPKVLVASAKENTGIPEVWKMIMSYSQQATASGYFAHRRQLQKMRWLDDCIDDQFRIFIEQPPALKVRKQLSKSIVKKELLPQEAARRFWKTILSRGNSKK